MLQKQQWWQRDRLMVPVLLGVYFFTFLACSLLSTGTYGGGDSWMHYLFAKYAFKHPTNLLDQWGKPLFTLLASPWAQFGFSGIKFFNIISAISTGYLSFLIARQHFQKLAWTSVVFVLSVPIYFVCVFSGLTEILFALFLIAGIYLYQNFHERWACVIISFLPFVRSEGFLIIPVFVLITLYYRQLFALFLLSAGTLFFSIIGYLIAHNWLWVFSTNPYLRAVNVYGKGPITQFIRANEAIAGVPQVLLVLLAILIFIRSFFNELKTKSFGKNRMLNIRFVLIFGSFAAYFIAHSIFWKLGIFGSLGLTRVMAGIGPCIGLTSFFAFEYLLELMLFQQFWSWGKYFILVLILAVLFMPLKVNRNDIPYRLSRLEMVQFQSCQWLKDNNFLDSYFYYYDPFVAHLLNLDPFDTKRNFSIYYGNEGLFLKQNAIIVWDSKFCPVEGHVPKRWFDENPNFELLHEERDNKSISDKGDTLQIRIYKATSDVQFINMN